MDMRPIHDAALRGDYAVVLRLGRIGHGWTQAQLGQRANVSRTVVSRFETGDRPLRDVDVRRRFADALDLPMEMFGLSGPGGPRVSGTRSEGDEVRRRAFLVAAGMAVLPAGQAAAQASPTFQTSALALTRRIEDALIHPEHGAVLDPTELPEIMRAARADYRATRYLSLADRLVNLVASAEAQVGQRPGPQAHALLAGVYNAIANLSCKLPASGLEWIAADRAIRAARLTEDPLLVAESQRVWSIAYRRAGRPEYALDICTTAADQLRHAGGAQCDLRTAEMLCTAAYCAAKAADRDRALELLREAKAITQRAQGSGQNWTEFSGPTNVNVYAVSVGIALHDPGISFTAMRAVNLGALASTERRARFLVDAANARLAADQPEQAARTLMVAARVAPQAVAARPAAAKLADDLRRVRPDLGRTLGAAGL
jgi:transcriptional regulator with XRE-family HTH domain